MNDWSLFAFVPFRGPILDCVVADSYDEISQIQKCVGRLIGYLPNAATEVRELFSGDGSRSLKSSDNRKRRGAKQIPNGINKLWFACHQAQQNHWRFRGVDKTRGCIEDIQKSLGEDAMSFMSEMLSEPGDADKE